MPISSSTVFPDIDFFENKKKSGIKSVPKLNKSCYYMKSLFMNNGVKVVDDNGDCMSCAQGLVNIVTKYSI